MTTSPEPLFDSKAFLGTVTNQHIDVYRRSHHDLF